MGVHRYKSTNQTLKHYIFKYVNENNLTFVVYA